MQVQLHGQGYILKFKPSLRKKGEEKLFSCILETASLLDNQL